MGSAITFDPHHTDVFGRLKTTRHQGMFDADFEYGSQPARWESLTVGSATISHQPQLGGVRMRLTTAAGDIAIRQSRPYHRYQPGKDQRATGAIVFGTAIAGQVQRFGFFDDSNGAFVEQNGSLVSTSNPSGMAVVIRSDVNGTINENRVPLPSWSCDLGRIAGINWNNLLMFFVEYAWYGGGSVRFGITINSADFILHEYSPGSQPSNAIPWCRSGNLPVRYEMRNITSVASVQDMIHWGVSVITDGGQDDQRGFTFGYGMASQVPRRTVPANSVRYPLMSFRNRVMGTLEYTQASSAITAATTTSLTATGTPWTIDQWKGRFVSYVNGGVTYTARITTNTTSALTIADIVTGGAMAAAPVAGQNYTIGLVNRGQILPRGLMLTASALCQVEVIQSSPGNPIVLTGGSFAALSGLGSPGSFAERDVSATALSGGEVVNRFTAPAGGSGLLALDLSNQFALYTNIRGNLADILTIAVTTPAASAADVGVDLVAQEAMS